MNKIDLNDTLLGTDIINVINKGCGLEGNFDCKVTIDFKKPVETGFEEIDKVESIELDKILRVDIIRNFLESHSDNFIIYATIPLGTFVKYILPQRDLLEADLYLRLLDEDGKVSEYNWRMRAFILDMGDKDESDALINKLSVGDQNNLAMFNFKLQLVFREMEIFRTGSVNPYVKDITRDDLIYAGFGDWLSTNNPRIDGEQPSIVFKYSETENAEELPNIDRCLIRRDPETRVMSRPNMLEFPHVIQKEYGLYLEGCNTYLYKPMENEFKDEKDCVYTIYRALPRLNKGKEGKYEGVDEAKALAKKLDSKEIIILYSSDVIIQDNNLYTYASDGDVIYIVPKASGFKSNNYNLESSKVNTTIDYATVPCDANRSGGTIDKEGMTVENKENIRQTNVTNSGQSEAVNTNIVVDSGGESFYNKSATTLSQQASSFSFLWQFGNPFIVKPQNITTMKILTKNNIVKEFTGKISRIYFTYDFATKHSVSDVVFNGFLTDIIEGE